MTFDRYLRQVVAGEPLSSDEAYTAANLLLSEDITEIKAAAFLTALRTRRETEAELFGFTMALMEHAVTIETGMETLDTCGTGGDGKGTFNISTAAALVVAACGIPVAKHGNRAVTGQTGSADVLETLGVRVDLKPHEALRCLETAGITFLFAPHYHPVMKQMGPIRRGLGVPTVFNYLGPLINPFELAYQVMGVSDPMAQEPIARAMSRLNRKHALVVHAANGMDEISPTGTTRIFDIQPEGIFDYHFNPADYAIEPAELSALQGKDSQDSARIIVGVLQGEPGPRRNVVLLNAAAALMAAGKGNYATCLALAAEAIDSGRALNTLHQLVRASQEVYPAC